MAEALFPPLRQLAKAASVPVFPNGFKGTDLSDRAPELVLGNRSFYDRISICSHYSRPTYLGVPDKRKRARAMEDLAPGQDEAVAATVRAIQRIAMAIVELPTEGRAASTRW
jgi:hypothetical protein